MASNPRLWCYLICISNDYDDFTFCYKIDPDVIFFHRECYNEETSRTTFPHYQVLIPKHIDVLLTIWNIVKNVPDYNNLIEYTEAIYPDMLDIMISLESCLKWSMNVKEL